MNICLPFSVREAKQLLAGLFAIEFIFFTAYLSIHIFFEEVKWGPFRFWFDLDAEASLPTWFSTIQLFVTAAVLLNIYLIQRSKPILFPYHFLAAGMVFLFLSADEAATIHEQVTSFSKVLELDFLMFKGDHGAWIPVYAALALIVSIPFIKTVKTLWQGYRHEFIITASGVLLFAIGAVFLEILSYQFFRAETITTLYQLEVAAEELMEMAGISIILYAFILLNIKISAAQNSADKLGE
jgi:hypothetical protein